VIKLENQTLIEKYLKDKQSFNNNSKREKGISEQTLIVYRRTLMSFDKSINKPFEQTTQDDILNHLQNYKPRTRNFHIVLLREFYRHIFNLEDTDPLPNCIRKIKPRTIEIDEIKYREKVVTPEEYNLLLENCVNPMWKAILEAYWCIGSRKMGVQMMLVKDVSYDGSCTHITIREDKTQPREVIYPDRCENLLKWKETLCPNRNNPDAPLFVVHKKKDGEHYEQIKSNYAYDMLMRLCEKAGLRHIKPHDLRHSCATRMLKEGTPTTHVCQTLGWRKNTNMLKVYDHNNVKDYEDWLNRKERTLKPTYELLAKQKEELQTVHGKEIQTLNERLKRTEDSMSQILEAIELNKHELVNLVKNQALASAKTVLDNAGKH
jgi:integrase